MTQKLLRFEGLFVLLASLYFYSILENHSWLWFILLLFVPDISMIGYAFNEQIGSILYNIFHSYLIPIFVVILAFFITNEWLFSIAIIWMAHIGMDRMLGFGLKYPSGFKDTHLQRV
ncbi:DUF4260 domain-containing protein [Halobacillus litoralis]|uniref:DUF4260 domain-containing protein n=1 Tax=Halobacillus litoralis TaxID=45668 RepID=A0A410MIA1_9BACI|nr:DUF4260 domain-containing protein [Halobacillus litoralis]QAS54467.1 DUF4260 domain-containing protein [Halobacillus litoralis]